MGSSLNENANFADSNNWFRNPNNQMKLKSSQDPNAGSFGTNNYLRYEHNTYNPAIFESLNANRNFISKPILMEVNTLKGIQNFHLKSLEHSYQ